MVTSAITEHLRSDGDLAFIVGEDEHHFVVFRSTMRGACLAWNKLPNPNGPDIEATKSEIALPNDDPKALRTLLLITHLKFYELPGQLSLGVFLSLATVCDNYDTVSPVRPFSTSGLISG
jgi:hypothetical protein